ncbi:MULTISPECIES: hypothetical protein [unclassified Streptomyces]|uniref:hypothetical protein n=1 Tax=unclassified Streptomyces TaxID=2593676 RepID=UPI000DC785FE|nr:MULTISPECIES: hypothetical protein [unclassified Streptomyces]AWZ08859.1 hypothetical protein DRB89_34805 [Streptomyces sp. ICC4]AWZ15774.1 hypothetical protein DRB96_29915 [Streptomyces sp. ICC1]
MLPARAPKIITRHRDGQIRAYVLDTDSGTGSGTSGALEPAAVFRPRPGDEVVQSAVRPGLEHVVYTTLNEVVCLSRTGDLVWTSAFEPRSDVLHGHRPGCELSLDGRTVWVYRPDAMAGRGSDQWVVYDAETGAILGRRELETVGHGAGHHVHPVDGSIYLDIGEGQDGAVILRGTVGADDGPEFVTYPWGDRCLVDLAPDGEQFMTVDHEQGDVAFHRHPSGDVLFTLPVEAFGYDPEETFVEWSGGYLTSDTAVVTLGGEDEDEEEWFRHHLVDVNTGTVGGEMFVETAHPYELGLLGDGSWLTEGPDGNPVRWSRAPLPPDRVPVVRAARG